jgi:hypothetical protein
VGTGLGSGRPQDELRILGVLGKGTGKSCQRDLGVSGWGLKWKEGEAV